MCWMAIIPAAIGLVGGMMGAQNAREQGDFNSQMLKQNAQFKNQAAEDALDRGRKASDLQRVQTQQMIGTQRAALAANGGDVNSGSAALLQDDTAMLGELDALTISNNAAREAYGYKVGAQQDMLNSSQVKKNAKAQATGSILGGIGSAFGSVAGSM